MKKVLLVVTSVLLALCMLAFAACAPSSAEAAEKKLKDAGYEVTAITEDELAELYDDEDIKMAGGLIAYKGDLADILSGGDVEYITAYWFADSASAKEFKEKYGEEIDEAEMMGVTIVTKLEGKVLYAGTEQAVKDFTK